MPGGNETEENSKRAEPEVQAGSWSSEDVFPGITSTCWPLFLCQATFTLTQMTLTITLWNKNSVGLWLEVSEVKGPGQSHTAIKSQEHTLGNKRWSSPGRMQPVRHPACPPGQRWARTASGMPWNEAKFWDRKVHTSVRAQERGVRNGVL